MTFGPYLAERLASDASLLRQDARAYSRRGMLRQAGASYREAEGLDAAAGRIRSLAEPDAPVEVGQAPDDDAYDDDDFVDDYGDNPR